MVKRAVHGFFVFHAVLFELELLGLDDEHRINGLAQYLEQTFMVHRRRAVMTLVVPRLLARL